MGKFPLRRKEKEDKVCELLRQGKTVREIAAAEHLSFSEIGRIKRKYFEMEDHDSAQKSKRSQALKLIDNGKMDLEIAIELDLSSKEMLEFRQEYLTLKNEDELLRLYPEIRHDIPAFLRLYKEMKLEDISAEEAAFALSDNRSFKQMTQEYESMLKKLRPLREEVEILENKRRRLLVSEAQELPEETVEDWYVSGDLFKETDDSSLDVDRVKQLTIGDVLNQKIYKVTMMVYYDGSCIRWPFCDKGIEIS
jgi:hypothetical protein